MHKVLNPTSISKALASLAIETETSTEPTISSGEQVGIGVGVGVGALIIILGIAIFFLRRRKNRRRQQQGWDNSQPYSPMQLSNPHMGYSYYKEQREAHTRAVELQSNEARSPQELDSSWGSPQLSSSGR